MQLVNRLPLTADLSIVELPDPTTLLGFLVAKATFQYDDNGSVSLDTQNPYPINMGEAETDWGQLPRDILPISEQQFEVLLLGSAHSPRHQPVTQMNVKLSVGSVHQNLMVFGDRTMEKDPRGNVVISEPEPFTSIPLDFAHAFGGTCQVEVDRETYLPIIDINNPTGRGFDPGPQAEGLCLYLESPKDYPVYDKVRHLPNVEDPNHLITGWEDTPPPACWGPLALDAAPRTLRAIKLPDKQVDPNTVDFNDALDHQKFFMCAHSDWIFPEAPRGARIHMNGLSPDGPVAFHLPLLRIMADYTLGERQGTRELTPQMLVLLPEEKRFYMVYRHYFGFKNEAEAEVEVEVERCMRLRMENE